MVNGKRSKNKKMPWHVPGKNAAVMVKRRTPEITAGSTKGRRSGLCVRPARRRVETVRGAGNAKLYFNTKLQARNFLGFDLIFFGYFLVSRQESNPPEAGKETGTKKNLQKEDVLFTPYPEPPARFAEQVRKENPDPPVIQVYPNPASAAISIRITGEVTYPVELRIIDLSGRIMQKESQYAAEQQYSLDNLAAGTYLYEILNHSGLLQRGKLVFTKR